MFEYYKIIYVRIIKNNIFIIILIYVIYKIKYIINLILILYLKYNKI